MGNFTIFQMFENPRRGRQARNFTTNVPKILDLKSSSEQIFSRKLSLGAPAYTHQVPQRNSLPYINRKLLPIPRQQLPTNPWNSHGNKDGRCFCKHLHGRNRKTNIVSELHQTAFLEKVYVFQACFFDDNTRD